MNIAKQHLINRTNIRTHNATINKSSLTFSKDGKEQAVFYDDKTTADADVYKRQG